jgi:hypothetical protein
MPARSSRKLRVREGSVMVKFSGPGDAKPSEIQQSTFQDSTLVLGSPH